ncbi:MAG: flagellar protein FlgN [Planctomycetes bacterium]|nr:flagellar protein FlgN [Planctomycetota bacterium]
MKSTATEIENKVDKLLTCLDKDSQHIQEILSQLNKLRSYVIKRDDSGLSKLLKIIQADMSSYRNHESKRQAIRKELANALGCNTEQMTLSALEARLPKGKKDQIIKKKAKLMSLIKELKKEHLSTILLLSECAKFNNLLLKSIFDLGKTGAVYYNSNGTTKQQTDMAFVNLHL